MRTRSGAFGNDGGTPVEGHTGGGRQPCPPPASRSATRDRQVLARAGRDQVEKVGGEPVRSVPKTDVLRTDLRVRPGARLVAHPHPHARGAVTEELGKQQNVVGGCGRQHRIASAGGNRVPLLDDRLRRADDLASAGPESPRRRRVIRRGPRPDHRDVVISAIARQVIDVARLTQRHPRMQTVPALRDELTGLFLDLRIGQVPAPYLDVCKRPVKEVAVRVVHEPHVRMRRCLGDVCRVRERLRRGGALQRPDPRLERLGRNVVTDDCYRPVVLVREEVGRSQKLVVPPRTVGVPPIPFIVSLVRHVRRGGGRPVVQPQHTRPGGRAKARVATDPHHRRGVIRRLVRGA